MVERLVANEKVEGSNPFARSMICIMSDLSKKKCVACDGDVTSFDTTEIHKYLKKVDGWVVKSNDDKNFYLIKVWIPSAKGKNASDAAIEFLIFED